MYIWQAHLFRHFYIFLYFIAQKNSPVRGSKTCYLIHWVWKLLRVKKHKSGPSNAWYEDSENAPSGKKRNRHWQVSGRLWHFDLIWVALNGQISHRHVGWKLKRTGRFEGNLTYPCWKINWRECDRLPALIFWFFFVPKFKWKPGHKYPFLFSFILENKINKK